MCVNLILAMFYQYYNALLIAAISFIGFTINKFATVELGLEGKKDWLQKKTSCEREWTKTTCSSTITIIHLSVSLFSISSVIRIPYLDIIELITISSVI